MAALELTNEEIRTRGLEVLRRELGPAGMIRFLRQFEIGRGDYSAERHQWLDDQPIEDLVAKLRESRDPDSSS